MTDQITTSEDTLHRLLRDWCENSPRGQHFVTFLEQKFPLDGVDYTQLTTDRTIRFRGPYSSTLFALKYGDTFIRQPYDIW